MFWFLIYHKDAQDLKAACHAESDEDALTLAGNALNTPSDKLECIQHPKAKEMAAREHVPVIE